MTTYTITATEGGRVIAAQELTDQAVERSGWSLERFIECWRADFPSAVVRVDRTADVSVRYRELERSPQAPACCQRCGLWLCGERAPSPIFESREELTAYWLYCSLECLVSDSEALAEVVR